MPTIERTLVEVEQWFAQINRLETSKRSLQRATFTDPLAYVPQWVQIEQEIAICRDALRQAIEAHERWPSRFERHAESLTRFHLDASYEDSVFIMTKYPGDDDSDTAAQLRRVIDLVAAEVAKRGYRPRLAADHSHHRWLWDNVELYLCGCSCGVAIVEDRYVRELNPNVAMEWGWMIAMGKDVLFLREKGFSHDRADWAGLISDPFFWDDPAPGIAAAVARFLPDRRSNPDV